ncbi:hypothetical protein GT347_15750 [Xylophilus rhododendri]|uniref:F-box domain-containing protein n=1 Tax=Xylophilus rhododendri TaxID=2697032 RepID=A0A857J8A0_9BURK|nr:hypothetical protein [Xylophilus rhododendri]QHI99301.1 hypothetical protein GT347_15750 [Xylophilus rhododendri]
MNAAFPSSSAVSAGTVCKEAVIEQLPPAGDPVSLVPQELAPLQAGDPRHLESPAPEMLGTIFGYLSSPKDLAAVRGTSRKLQRAVAEQWTSASLVWMLQNASDLPEALERAVRETASMQRLILVLPALRTAILVLPALSPAQRRAWLSRLSEVVDARFPPGAPREQLHRLIDAVAQLERRPADPQRGRAAFDLLMAQFTELRPSPRQVLCRALAEAFEAGVFGDESGEAAEAPPDPRLTRMFHQLLARWSPGGGPMMGDHLLQAAERLHPSQSDLANWAVLGSLHHARERRSYMHSASAAAAARPIRRMLPELPDIH